MNILQSSILVLLPYAFVFVTFRFRISYQGALGDDADIDISGELHKRYHNYDYVQHCVFVFVSQSIPLHSPIPQILRGMKSFVHASATRANSGQ